MSAGANPTILGPIWSPCMHKCILLLPLRFLCSGLSPSLLLPDAIKCPRRRMWLLHKIFIHLSAFLPTCLPNCSVRQSWGCLIRSSWKVGPLRAADSGSYPLCAGSGSYPRCAASGSGSTLCRLRKLGWTHFWVSKEAGFSQTISGYAHSFFTQVRNVLPRY
jgi:hypothetical protein